MLLDRLTLEPISLEASLLVTQLISAVRIADNSALLKYLPHRIGTNKKRSSVVLLVVAQQLCSVAYTLDFTITSRILHKLQ